MSVNFLDFEATRKAVLDQRGYCERHFPSHRADTMQSGVTIGAVEALLALADVLPALIASAKDAQDFIVAQFGPALSDDPRGWSDEDARSVSRRLEAALAALQSQAPPSPVEQKEG